ncbi:DUF3768 domain-containing protein [Candidatus Pacearchaeota archaeon]|nr:DUF3768 domain-containing protein [Candidatus Pacearchaeota archaeon]
MSQKNSTIQKLNDSFRQTGIGGKILITRGIQNLERPMITQILNTIVTYNNFTPANDPYGEHDFGSFEIRGYKVFWKIDYYNKEFEYGSEDPSNRLITGRVLTVMLAEEY